MPTKLAVKDTKIMLEDTEYDLLGDIVWLSATTSLDIHYD